MNFVLIVLIYFKMLLGILCAENNTREIKGNKDQLDHGQQYQIFRHFHPQETTTAIKRQYKKLENTNLFHSELGILLNATYYGQDILEATPSISKEYPPDNDLEIQYIPSFEFADLINIINTTNIRDRRSSKSLKIMSNLEVSRERPHPNSSINNNSYVLPNSINFTTSNNSNDPCNLNKYITNDSNGTDSLLNENVSKNKSNKTDQMPKRNSKHDRKPSNNHTKKRVKHNPNKRRTRFNTSKNDARMKNISNNMASDSQRFFVKNIMNPDDPNQDIKEEDVKKINFILACYLSLCIAVFIVNVIICLVLAFLRD